MDHNRNYGYSLYLSYLFLTLRHVFFYFFRSTTVEINSVTIIPSKGSILTILLKTWWPTMPTRSHVQQLQQILFGGIGIL